MTLELPNKRGCPSGLPNLVLIGYRATGKTSVGAELARVLNRPFVDLDLVLVAEAGRSVAEIVAQGGWEEFRRREKELVARYGQKSGQILATGGGAILDPQNVQILRENGFLVWLKADPETIRKRLSLDKSSVSNRPSLTEADYLAEVERVLRQRESLYQEAADMEVETDGISIAQVAAAIITAAQDLVGRRGEEAHGR
jgi:shikimate kinase